MGNDPTLFTMSRWRFPIKLQSNMYRTWGSNSLNQPYEGRPFSTKPRHLFEHQEGFEPPSLRFAGVCLKPLDHWCIYILSLWQGLNLRPIDYKSIALPAELQRHLELMEGLEPTYHLYKRRVIAVIRHQHFSSWCGLRSHYLRRIRSALYQVS